MIAIRVASSPSCSRSRSRPASGSARRERLDEMRGPASTAVAAAADVGYCSPELKKILRRVLMSCGLVGGGAARGCQPVQAKNVATMSGDDFNALFRPMKDRGGIIQFDKDKAELDAGRPRARRSGVRRSARRELVLRRRARVARGLGRAQPRSLEGRAPRR